MTGLQNERKGLNVKHHQDRSADTVVTTETGMEESLGRQANKGILADRIARELNVPRRTAARVLDAVLDSVRDLLRGRGKVAVKGFGTFERRIRKGRAYKHPLTGESIAVADKETVMFKPSDQLIADTRTGSAPRRTRGASLRDMLFDDGSADS